MPRDFMNCYLHRYARVAEWLVKHKLGDFYVPRNVTLLSLYRNLQSSSRAPSELSSETSSRSGSLTSSMVNPIYSPPEPMQTEEDRGRTPSRVSSLISTPNFDLIYSTSSHIFTLEPIPSSSRVSSRVNCKRKASCSHTSDENKLCFSKLLAIHLQASQVTPQTSSHESPSTSSQATPQISSHESPSTSSQTPEVNATHLRPKSLRVSPSTSSCTTPRSSSPARPSTSSQATSLTSLFESPSTSSQTTSRTSSPEHPSTSSQATPQISSHESLSTPSQTSEVNAIQLRPKSLRVFPSTSSRTTPQKSSQTTPRTSSPARPSTSSQATSLTSSFGSPSTSSQTPPKISRQEPLRSSIIAAIIPPRARAEIPLVLPRGLSDEQILSRFHTQSQGRIKLQLRGKSLLPPRSDALPLVSPAVQPYTPRTSEVEERPETAPPVPPSNAVDGTVRGAGPNPDEGHLTMSSQSGKSVREHGKRRHCPQHHPHVISASIAGPSTSGTSSQVTLPVTADLASLFECPVCFDYVLPPILQCPSGHLVCSSCRPKLSCCPTCRGPLGNIRNLAMEKVASSVMFLCKYSTSGCTASLLHTEKPEHEEVCEYRPYSCPCPGASCKWQGSLDQVMPHLLISHKSITTLQGEDIVFLVTDINLPGAVDWVMMQSCFGHHFMLVLEKQEKFPGHQQFFAIVQLIGSRKQAEIFAYRLELNGHRRRLTWEATPRSIHEGIASAILSSDCLVFDTSIVHLFEDNGNLGINVTISMVRESDKSRDSW